MSTRGAGTVFFGYASLRELVQHAINDPSEMPESTRHSRNPGGAGDWAGGSWKTAKQTALSGDIDGARRLAPAVLHAVNAMFAHQPRLDPVYKLDEGRWIDVARYVRGEPECWGDMVEGDAMPRKGAAVVINASYGGGVSSSSVDSVGVAVGSAVLGLQAQGYAVTVYAALRAGATGYGTKYNAMTIHAPINPGGAPLDVSHLSSVLRPWFLRRVIFSIMETYQKDIRTAFNTGGGYGSPSRLTPADLEKITGLKNAVAVDIGVAVKLGGDQVTADIVRQIKGA